MHNKNIKYTEFSRYFVQKKAVTQHGGRVILDRISWIICGIVQAFFSPYLYISKRIILYIIYSIASYSLEFFFFKPMCMFLLLSF